MTRKELKALYQDKIDDLMQPNAIENYIDSVYQEAIEHFNYESEASKGKINTNHANAINQYTSKRLFIIDPANQTGGQSNSILLLDETNQLLLRALHKYLAICSQYDILPSTQGFSIFSGISRQLIYNISNGINADNDGILTHVQLDIVKIIKDYSQNQLIGALYQTTIGQVTLANNERSIGLNYTAQATLFQGEVQKALSTNDLPQLEG